MVAEKFFLKRVACVFFAMTTYASCGASDERDLDMPLSPRADSAKSIQFTVPVTTTAMNTSLMLRQGGGAAQESDRPRKRAEISKLVLPAIFESREEAPLLARLPKGLKPEDFPEKTSVGTRAGADMSAPELPYIPPLILAKFPSDASPSSSSNTPSAGAPSPISPVGLSSKRLMSFEELSYLVAVRDVCVPELSGNLFEDLERHQSILIRGSADRREQEFKAFRQSPFLEFYREAQHNKRTLLTQHVQSLFPVFLYVVKGAADFIENYEEKITNHKSGHKPISTLGLETSVSLIGDIHHFFCTHGSRMSHFYTAVLNVASESDRDSFDAKAHDYTQELSHTGEVISLTFIQRFYLEAPGYLFALKAAYENCCLKPAIEVDTAVSSHMGITSPRTRAGSSPREKILSFVTPKHSENSKAQKKPVRSKSLRTTPREKKDEKISDLLPSSLHEDAAEEVQSTLYTEVSSSSSRLSGDEGERTISPRRDESVVDMREFLCTSPPAPSREPTAPQSEKTSPPKRKSLFSGLHFKGK